MAKTKVSCKHGKLKVPVRDAKTGYMRRCKLKPKTKAGKSQDRKKTSSEYHERRYKCEKKGGKLIKGICKKKKR